jgi:fatty-acyl-CoA synthase
VSGSGRILVPINFRLQRTEEVRYIVEHCGAEVLLIDPELVDDACRRSTVRSTGS